MSELILYRGDAEKIKTFQLNKTKSYSLLGPGIYLTDAQKIAETYRDKGTFKTNSNIIYEGKVKTRTEAFENAFESFVDHGTHRFTGNLSLSDFKTREWIYPEYRHISFKKLPKSFLLKMKNLYETMIDEKLIVAEHVVNNNQSIAIKVFYLAKEKIGYITEFKFEKEVFEASILKIDGCLNNRNFWDLMWEHKIDIGNESCFQDKKPMFTYSDYISKNLGSKHSLSLSPFAGRNSFFGKSREKTLRAIKNALKPNGYKGLEYEGGILIGTCGRHRAFCIWGDEYVNDSLVKRFQ